jgi:hypothetical protein
VNRPGLLGKLDERNDRIRDICNEEGASIDQYWTWMISAMAETIKESTYREYRESYEWLNDHSRR